MEKSIVVVGNPSELLQSIYTMVSRDPRFKDEALIHSGTEAMRYITEHKPDVILTELGLADLDGLSILNRVYQDDAYNPFIYVLSAMQSDRLLMTLSKLDVVYVSIKPTNPEPVYNNLVMLIGDLDLMAAFQSKDAGRVANLQLVPKAGRGYGLAEPGDWGGAL